MRTLNKITDNQSHNHNSNKITNNNRITNNNSSSSNNSSNSSSSNSLNKIIKSQELNNHSKLKRRN